LQHEARHAKAFAKISLLASLTAAPIARPRHLLQLDHRLDEQTMAFVEEHFPIHILTDTADT
jgi:hypothetical protein